MRLFDRVIVDLLECVSRVSNKSQVSLERERAATSRFRRTFILLFQILNLSPTKLLLYLYKNDGGKLTAPCSLLSRSLIPSIPSRRMIDSLSFTNATLCTH